MNREFNLPWREAGPPNHLDDSVDPDQLSIKNSLSAVWVEESAVLAATEIAVTEITA